ncbi:hypothetical protein AQUCO_01000315v1 [Aquilegia coerulea]|uniref:AB hydrolase-1 domain-containing protein n=1 Tax=Aquilegia coerulea TaxID=218851 RepID=A0A2G5E9C8_AQUCA|nr:hypothetical protein AQUCO_01000315v1 [Aquilegia coerulea]
MGHGAWSWYKVATLLKSAGHRVTALDLCASGIHPKQLHDIKSLYDYVQPLMDFMDSLPLKERVILVGHSFGGVAISLAMENFSSKIDLAVFVTAVMPNYTSPPGTIIQELLKKSTVESLLDCEFSFDQGMENPPTSLLFGPDYRETKMYKCCQPEDVMLAQFLIRPAKLFIEDLMNDTLLTKEKYGSVKRVYVVVRKMKSWIKISSYGLSRIVLWMRK